MLVSLLLMRALLLLLLLLMLLLLFRPLLPLLVLLLLQLQVTEELSGSEPLLPMLLSVATTAFPSSDFAITNGHGSTAHIILFSYYEGSWIHKFVASSLLHISPNFVLLHLGIVCISACPSCSLSSSSCVLQFQSLPP